MFHLSLPVDALEPCLRFYRTCLDARVEPLGPRSANLFVLGAQLTLHERRGSALGPEARREMHFGAVLGPGGWAEARDRLAGAGIAFVRHVEPVGGARGKLVVADPAGNLLELNCDPLEGTSAIAAADEAR